jgi:6-phosphogluconolactonase
MAFEELVVANGDVAAEIAAQKMAAGIAAAISDRGVAHVALSGGSSPRKMFGHLAKHSLHWSKVHWYPVDERVVLPDSNEYNFRMANEVLFQPAGIASAQIHRVESELGAVAAAARFDATIREAMQLSATAVPVFDVLHRGMGPDMHTASLFPGEAWIENRSESVASVWVEKFKQSRVTLLPAVLLAARYTLVLAPGADKREALSSVLRGDYDPLHKPAQLALRDAGPLLWIHDQPGV